MAEFNSTRPSTGGAPAVFHFPRVYRAHISAPRGYSLGTERTAFVEAASQRDAARRIANAVAALEIPSSSARRRGAMSVNGDCRFLRICSLASSFLKSVSSGIHRAFSWPHSQPLRLRISIAETFPKCGRRSRKCPKSRNWRRRMPSPNWPSAR